MTELICILIGFFAGFPIAYNLIIYLLKKDAAMLDRKIQRLQIEQNILSNLKQHEQNEQKDRKNLHKSKEINL